MCGDIVRFKLVKNFDTLNGELGVRFYLGQNGSKIGGLFTATGKLLKQLWDEDDEHYDDINYYLDQLEDLFDVPDLDYRNNNYNFAFKKSFITDEVREIIDNLNFYLTEIGYEVIEETIDTPNIEYQDDKQFAYKPLDEEVLNEEKLYKVSYKTNSNKDSNHRSYYFLGADKLDPNITTLDKLCDYLKKLETNSKEKINAPLVNKLNTLGAIPIDILNVNNIRHNIVNHKGYQDLMLNSTFKTARDHSHDDVERDVKQGTAKLPLNNLIVHHIDGSEVNEDKENLIGVNNDLIHKLLHTLPIVSQNVGAVTWSDRVPVAIYNGKKFVTKPCRITVEIK